MKKRIFITFLILLTLGLFLGGCAAGSGDKYGPEDNGVGDNSSTSIIVSSSNRKIVYTADLSIKSSDLLKTTNAIKQLLDPEEDWVQSENLQTNYNYLTIRIKTTKLNDFIEELQSEYETVSFRLNSEDISHKYVDVAARKATLQAELNRWLTLMQNASTHDLITITERVSYIETQIDRLDGNLIEFDSLVDFSTVNVYIYGPKASPKPPSYGKTLGNTITGAWNAAVSVLKFLGQVIVAIIPFSIIIIPVGGIVVGSIYFAKYTKKKKENKKDDNNEE